MPALIVRAETEDDIAAIRRITIAAFADHPFSQQTEHLIIEALRNAGALELSLVAEIDGHVVGHVGFSACRIGDSPDEWRLLGPIAVDPEYQGRGAGRALVEEGLTALRAMGAAGCALVGDPAFYGRFGFRHRDGLTCHGVPDEYVLALPFADAVPSGELIHHPAFLVGPETAE